MNENNFDLISSYFKKNSSLYDTMKHQLENNQLVSFQTSQVVSASQSGDKVKATIQQINENGQLINKDYELEETSKGNDFNLIKASNE